jgi:hypothetical protein
MADCMQYRVVAGGLWAMLRAPLVSRSCKGLRRSHLFKSDGVGMAS